VAHPVGSPPGVEAVHDDAGNERLPRPVGRHTSVLVKSARCAMSNWFCLRSLLAAAPSQRATQSKERTVSMSMQHPLAMQKREQRV